MNNLLVHLNGLAQYIGNNDLKEILEKPYNQIWFYTERKEFDKILDQRIYHPIRKSVEHFINGDYESSIALISSSAEMLTYLIFFIHTNSISLLKASNNSMLYDKIKGNSKDSDFKKAFGEKGSQSKRLEILEESGISKSEGGHDIQLICKELKVIHDIRIQYFHHWKLFETQKADAKNCIKSIFEACSNIFEVALIDGQVKINHSVYNWIKNL